MKTHIILAAVAAISILSACESKSGVSASPDNAASISSTDDAAAAATAARTAIEGALRADAATASYGYTPARTTAMRAIDLSGTPIAFRTAYLNHIYAWERMVKAHAAWQSLTNDANTGPLLVDQVVCGLLDCQANPIADRIDAENRLKAEMAAASAEITDTFHSVETVATENGANLQAS